MTLSLPQRAGEMVCVCDRELQPAASRATQGPIPGGQGSGAHLFLWQTSPQSPCLLDDVLWFDGCLVTEEVIQESAVITCKHAWLFLSAVVVSMCIYYCGFGKAKLQDRICWPNTE